METELVATWQPTGEGWISSIIDNQMSWLDLLEDILVWSDDDIEGIVGTITIERKPKGYVESLPEFEGW